MSFLWEKGSSMDETFLLMLKIHIVDVLVSYSIFGLYIFDITGERLQFQKLGKFVLFSGLSSGSIGFVLVGMSELDTTVAYFLSSDITLVFSAAAITFLWHYDAWRAFTISCIAGIIQVCCVAIVASLMSNTVLQDALDIFLYYSCYFGIYLAAGVAASRILQNIHFSRLLHFYLEEGKQVRLKAVGAFLLELMAEIFFVLRRQLHEETTITYNAGMAMLMVLLVLLLLHLSGKEESRRKIQYQESMILQQQIYVEHLEQMQKEMRIFRHDYKNTLTGMYLYAKEGDAEKIQEILEKLEIDFDQKIGEKIHAATQIGNIHMPEMKSLVLSKLTKMKKIEIACRLEVLYPIDGFAMDVWDYNRCLGILLDNAIEAAAVQPEPYVELQLVYEGGYFTTRVANPWNQEADLAHMWDEGYSTKGVQRGMGLSNYKRILEHYPQAVSVTSCENQVFVQELTVPV